MPTSSLSPSRRPRGQIIAGVVAILVAIGWWLSRPPVANDDVEAFLNRTEGGGRFHFTADHVGTVREGEGQVQLTVEATAHVLLPLYQAIDTPDYLEHTLGLNPAAAAEGRRRLEEAGAKEGPAPPANPYHATLLQPRLPADATVKYQAVLEAHREHGSWVFVRRSGGFLGGTPAGEARSTFAEPIFILGDRTDDERLRAQVADFKAYSERAAAELQDRDRAHAAAVQARRQAFLALLIPGTVLAGVGHEAGDQHATPLYLQLTAVNPDHTVTALLRNDGSWRRGRSFTGAWTADDEFLHPVLTLTSAPDEAVRNGGPFLEGAQTWTFNLREGEPGVFTEETPRFQYRFERLAPAQVADLEAHLDAEIARALAATDPGRLYEGTATNKATGAAETVLLKITARAAGSQAVEAELSSTVHSWARAFRGGLLVNARRSGGEPIRLHSPGSAAAAEADAASPLGYPEDLDLALGFDGPALVGEDSVYSYRLQPASAADRQQLQEQRAARARDLLNVLRPGLALDGTMREDQGFVARGRLEIDSVDPVTGKVTGRIKSLTKVLVYRELAGGLDPSGDSVVLSAGRGNLDSSGDFNAPFLLGGGPATIRLKLFGTDLIGTLLGDSHWGLTFPAGFFLQQPLESADGKGPPASGGVYPAFPTAAGAYLLSHGRWEALPTNNAHTVVETIKPKSDAELTLNIIDLVQQGLTEIDRERKKFKVTYLVFDGKGPIPEPSGPGVTLLVVGRAPGAEPLAEVGGLETTKDGVRKIAVGGAAPGQLRIGAERVAAYVRSPGPGLVLLTTTEILADGGYAVVADHAYEFVQK